MKREAISKNIVLLTSLLKDVMNALNVGISGVVLIVDDQGVMKGILTDGDVRRALLGGAGLNEPVSAYMNTAFIYGKTANSHEDNVRLMSERIRHIPVLDEFGRPVDLISWAEMWRLPVTEPYLGGNELKYVVDCITSNWISSQGNYIKEFEMKFADYYSIDHALTVSSGTAALHLALKALGVGPGDEVIVPSLTFAACANVVIHCGAVPVFADVSEKTWTLDPASFDDLITEKTKAVMPVHLYGHPCDMDPILQIAKEHGLYVVEDCAEAIGSRYKSRHVGTLGDVGCFSFFANKVITTGEGGMIITHDKKLRDKIAMLRDHGMSKEKKYWHELAGFNYRMTNIQAAIGVAQMEKIDRFLANRKALSDNYTAQLAGIKGITLPAQEPWARNIFWLYSVLIDETVAGITATDMIRKLRDEGIESRPFFSALHLQPPYPATLHALPVSERLARQGMSLPTGNDIGAEDVKRVTGAFRKILQNISVMKECS